MEKSFVNALKLSFEGSYIIDFEKNSCEILFSSFIPWKYKNRLMSIDRFMEFCINVFDEEYKSKLFQFIDRTNLRNAYINDKNYSMVYSVRVSEDSYALYKATMIPQTSDSGLVCTSEINESDSMTKINLINSENIQVVFLRLQNNPAATIDYANDWFYNTLGYNRKEMKERFNNSLARIAVDDFTKILSSYKKSDDVDQSGFKIRLKHKSGKTVWMHCTCTHNIEDDTYTAIMVDITEQIERNQATKFQDQMYKVILENLDIVYFVYDVEKDLMTMNISTETGEYKEIIFENYLSNIENIESIHPQYRKQLGIIFSRIIRGGRSKEVFEYKSSLRSNDYEWVRINMSEVKDAEGKLYRIIGKLDSIEKEMRHREAESHWKEIAERDHLTGLLSRNAGVEMMRKNIEEKEGGSGALFLLDIDDFKTINDTEGHLEGDRVLSEIANAFSSQFRTEDIVCRYGGDEMLAFASDMVNLEVIRKKSDNILKAIRCVDAGDGKTLTCSIGISVKTPGNPIAYENMFRSADMALYSAKNNDKNCSYIFK